jgi:hypothetical protein
MRSEATGAPKQLFGQYVILTEDHRAMLESLKTRRRISYSETIRRGIELVAREYASQLQENNKTKEGKTDAV